jgi:hypothetical protein
MPNLEELSTNKIKLFKMFLMDQELVDLISGATNHSLPAFDLQYEQVFPYLRVDDIVNETKTYFCFEVDVPSVSIKNDLIENVLITIQVIVHNSNMRTTTGTLADRITNRVNTLLNGADGFGVTDVKLKGSRHFIPIVKFYGRETTYAVKDLNLLCG